MYPKVVSLFCGAGGLSKGFCERFDIVLAVDSNKYATFTFKANYPTTKVLCVDIRNVEWESELKKIGLTADDIDVVIGGPPCQGFSKGNMQTRNAENPLNDLWRNYLEVVCIIKPAWFVMENVPGMKSIKNGDKGTVDEIVKVFHNELGYHVEVKTLLASEYGVPQNRRRVFFVGSRDRFIFPFPKGYFSEDNFITVDEAIGGDLPPLQDSQEQLIEGVFEPVDYFSPPQSQYQRMIRGGQKFVTSHVTVMSSKAVRNRWRDIKPGGNWKEISTGNKNGWRNVSDDELVSVSHSNLYKRLDPKKPSITIANFRRSMICHPIEDRILSIREAARLQSFPDDHIFIGPKLDQQQMVANAVPPLLSRAIARHLYYIMKGFIDLETAPIQSLLRGKNNLEF